MKVIAFGGGGQLSTAAAGCAGAVGRPRCMVRANVTVSTATAATVVITAAAVATVTAAATATVTAAAITVVVAIAAAAVTAPAAACCPGAGFLSITCISTA